MSVFKPFRAVRPKKEYADKVAALPYDVMNSEEARQKVEGKPYSFIHVDKAEVDLTREPIFTVRRFTGRLPKTLKN